MSPGDRFNRLSNSIQENASYQLNANGAQLIEKYHSIINSIEKALFPLLENITQDPGTIAKQTAVQVISSINSNRQGTEEFELMSRLDTMTNGGKTPIQGDSFTFNQQDNILNYLEKI